MKGLLKAIILLSVFLVAPACSSSTKAKKAKKRIIMIDTPRYGKNSMFFSAKYQRQLKSRAKKNARRNRR
ncbi:MAG: hypothetical protein JSV24_08645 [Bacteroidales bacterium]|nr:MAG: hypothetical protein JSV24_08645 [Bacteroidales bacterium]